MHLKDIRQNTCIYSKATVRLTFTARYWETQEILVDVYCEMLKETKNKNAERSNRKLFTARCWKTRETDIYCIMQKKKNKKQYSDIYFKILKEAVVRHLLQNTERSSNQVRHLLTDTEKQTFNAGCWKITDIHFQKLKEEKSALQEHNHKSVNMNCGNKNFISKQSKCYRQIRTDIFKKMLILSIPDSCYY